MGDFDDVFAVFFTFACEPAGQILHVSPFDFAGFAFFAAQQMGFVADVGEQALHQGTRRLLFGAALVIVHQLHKLLQMLAAFAVELSQGFHARGRLKQAATVLACIFVELAQGGVADAALRRGGGAQKGGVVVGVGQ